MCKTLVGKGALLGEFHVSWWQMRHSLAIALPGLPGFWSVFWMVAVSSYLWLRALDVLYEVWGMRISVQSLGARQTCAPETHFAEQRYGYSETQPRAERWTASPRTVSVAAVLDSNRLLGGNALMRVSLFSKGTRNQTLMIQSGTSERCTFLGPAVRVAKKDHSSVVNAARLFLFRTPFTCAFKLRQRRKQWSFYCQVQL